MEKDIVAILVIIFIIAFAILIIYRSISVFLFFKDTGIPVQDKKDLPLEFEPQEKKVDIEDEYKKIIEKSKQEYKAFMDKKATAP